MSYAYEVIADSSGKFFGNAVRFETREEAEAGALELAGRWFAVRDWRVVESSDPVNYRIDFEAGRPVRMASIDAQAANPHLAP